MKIEVELMGREISGNVTTGIEGDPTIPGGTRQVWEVEDVGVVTDEGEDITDDCTEEEMAEYEEILLTNAFQEG